MKFSFLKVAGMACALLLGANAQAQSLTSGEQQLLTLATELYPDLFNGNLGLQQAQGYTYLRYNSGAAVGFKDGDVYVAGGPFGPDIQKRGTVSQVATQLTNLKNSIAITPNTSMTNLFNYAAQVYPDLFKNGSAFKVDAAGYLYKQFDGGIYAAIKDNIVWVKGGSFGSYYTSVGGLNNVLAQLEQTLNNNNNNPGGGTTIPSIPSGNYNLTVSGTVSVMGFAQPFSVTVNDIPAPNLNDQADIEEAFKTAVASTEGITITHFSYTTKSNTADLVEFDVSVSATISQSGLNMNYSYALNYKYTKK